MSRKRSSYDLREGRVYLHKICRDYTGVTEEHFEGLCNPFKPCIGTWCTTCNRHDKLKNFCWADTNERIDKYRARLKRKAPASYRLWSLLLPLLGAITGLVVAFGSGGGKSPASLIGLPILGLGIFKRLISPLVFTHVVGIKFYQIP